MTLRAVTILFIILSSALRMDAQGLTLEKGDRIAFIGGGLGSRMMAYGHTEAAIQAAFPDKELLIRNMANEGDTPALRQHPGRKNNYAFPGADKFQPIHSSGTGHSISPDEWLTQEKADIVIAFFGFSAAMDPDSSLENFRAELNAWIKHSLSQQYNGHNALQIAIVSPIAFENLSTDFDLPDGKEENKRLKSCSKIMKDCAAENGILFLDAFAPSINWYADHKEALTRNGVLLNDKGYRLLASLITETLFGKRSTPSITLHNAIMEKNWMWKNYYKIPNGVHVFGQRYKPYGPVNYPPELEKLQQLIANRDEMVWAAANNRYFDLEAADASTRDLPPIETNYNPDSPSVYLSGKEMLKTMQVAPGFKMELFASEEQFPELANPVQMSFDNKGRLWVATMPSYPHYRPGDSKPDDKLLIFEDTNNDGKADKMTVFADMLHVPMGFELAPEGVYVSQAPDLILLTDTDGDDKADKKEIVLSGFDHHDTHHAIGAFSADPSGAIFLSEGVFLRSNIETPYGTVRSSDGGFYRYYPQRAKLERYAQLSIPNPWGISIDDWGQEFYLFTSGPSVSWMQMGAIKHPRWDRQINPLNILTTNEVRPTSGLEIISSRHFPEDMQGDIILCNAKNYLGSKQHKLMEDGTGYTSKFRHDLFSNSNGNFRPVDLEFAPDGSLYVVDWHNELIGHMQHSARDPKRDHKHGRIYRITYPSRPLVEPTVIEGASIASLFKALELPELRTRYRVRRELRSRNTDDVISGLNKWTNSLSHNNPDYERLLLEGLWVMSGANKVDYDYLDKLLNANDYKVRAAAIRVMRDHIDRVSDIKAKLQKAAADPHGRVRLAALSIASLLDQGTIIEVVRTVSKHPVDKWMYQAYTALGGERNANVYDPNAHKIKIPKHITNNKVEKFYIKGKELYEHGENCHICHAKDGKGLPTAGFPPLAGSEYVNENIERLVLITTKGLQGPIEVKGKTYNSAMAGFHGRLSTRDMQALFTYIRNAWGNQGSFVPEAQIEKIIAKHKDLPPMPNIQQINAAIAQ